VEYYFQGMDSLNQGNLQDALSAFRKSATNVYSYTGILSAEQAVRLEKASSRFTKTYNYYKKNPHNILLKTRYWEALYSIGNYEHIISLYKDEIKPDNALTRVYLRAKLALNNNNFEQSLLDEIFIWFTDSSLSESHVRFYNQIKPFFAENLDARREDFWNILTIRVSVYNGTYGLVLRLLKDIENQKSSFSQFLAALPFTVLSDIGKTYTYTSKEYEKYARIFIESATSIKEKKSSQKFMLLFYSARLYDKMPSWYRGKAIQQYKAAMDASELDSHFDNALWYYLSNYQDYNPGNMVNMLKKYAPQWHTKDDFDGIFDEVSVFLVRNHEWQKYFQVYELVLSYGGSASIAKYSYVVARLLQEDFLSVPQGLNKADYIKTLFEATYIHSHDSTYYRLLSAEKLDKNIEDDFQSSYSDKPLEYTDMGQYLFETLERNPEKVFSLFKKFAYTINQSEAEKIIQTLGTKESLYPKAYTESLRMADFFLQEKTTVLTHTLLELLHPRFYAELIESECAHFKLPPYLLYGLVKTESYFDASVHSGAGAIGLTQLMTPTAGDVARKLRIKNYDLQNPEINVKFGAFYLEELIRRLNYSPIMAILSYNAGITRVRIWMEEQGNLPNDIFLESVPYKETRNYGRKVLSAAALYGYLYFDKDMHDIVSEIMH